MNGDRMTSGTGHAGGAAFVASAVANPQPLSKEFNVSSKARGTDPHIPAPLRVLRMRAAATRNAARVPLNDLAARGCPTLPPAWAESVDGQLHLGASTYRSAHVTIPLGGYEAWFDHSTDQDDRIHMAELTAQVQQRGNRSHPVIAFERNSGEDGDPKWRGVAKYELSIDEAVSLAHTPLLLVDVAIGVTDESSED